MNELQRQAYMKVMGVDCYAPRLTLPGAKVSELCALPDFDISRGLNQQESAFAANDLQLNDQPMVKGSAAIMKALLGDTDTGMIVKKQVDAAINKKTVDANLGISAGHFDSQRETSSKSCSIPEFSLTVIRGANILLIDGKIPVEFQQREYLQYLHNILFALGAATSQLSLDPFVWPMVKNTQVDQSESAARQTLGAFLDKQVAQLSPACVVVMGELAAKYVCDTPIVNGTAIKHERFRVPVICTESAGKSMLDPTLKQKIWNDLHPLNKMIRAQ